MHELKTAIQAALQADDPIQRDQVHRVDLRLSALGGGFFFFIAGTNIPSHTHTVLRTPAVIWFIGSC